MFEKSYFSDKVQGLVAFTAKNIQKLDLQYLFLICRHFLLHKQTDPVILEAALPMSTQLAKKMPKIY